MPTKAELQEKIVMLEEALEEAHSILADALEIEDVEEDDDSAD